MKKITLFIFLSISFCNASLAQLTGGIKGGLNLAEQKWKVEVTGISGSEKFKGTSFHLGGYLNYHLSEFVSLQPELIYNNLKFDADGEDLTLNYLSIPIMFGYGFEQNKFNLHAGPQLGFLLSTDPSELRSDGYFKGIDFSLALGATLNFDKFNFTVRYAVGLINIAEDKLSDEVSVEFGEPVDISIKNNNLQISIGYKLFGE